jgi:hypothetical protein
VDIVGILAISARSGFQGFFDYPYRYRRLAVRAR